ncbi:MAG: cyclic nucleotide-binding domain-containing protein, partial [Nitrospirae bacterium]
MISFSSDQIEQKFCRLPLLAGCSRATLARVIPYLEELSLKAGDTLVQKGDAARQLYVVIDGQCALQLPSGPIPVADVVGEEALMGAAFYHASVTAMTDCRILVLPQQMVAGLLREYPALPDAASQLLLQKHGHRLEKAEKLIAESRFWVMLLGWLVTLLLPILLLVFGEKLALGHNALLFLSLLSVTLSMWMFRLVPEYVPGIFVVAVTMGLGLAPAKVVLSGFTSDSFFLAMSVFGVGAVITSSGLSYRFLLWLLRLFPQNQLGFNLSIAATGLLLTPIVPSIIGRVALVTPLMGDMLNTLRLRRQGVAATALAASTFNGLTLMSAVFLTSKAPNFLILAMMPSQVQGQFQMIDWFVAAAVAGGVMLVLYLASVLLFFRNAESPSLTRPQIQGQLDLLGPMQAREWAALASILLFALGVITFSIHQIPPSWIG